MLDDLQKFCRRVKPIKLSVTKVPEELEYKQRILEITAFLDVYKKVPLSLRYYCILNSIDTIPVCKSCDNPVTYKKDYPDQGFADYCSPKCSRSDKTVDEKTLKKLSNKDWLYEQRIALQRSKKDIARELNCSVVPVTKWLKQLEIEQPREDIKNIKLDLPEKECLYDDYYIKNLTLLDIAKKYNVSNTTVKKWFSFYEIELSEHKETIKNKVIPKTIRTNLKVYGVPFAAQKHFTNEVWINLNDPDWLYEQHIIQQKSLVKMSKELGVSDLTVKRYFDEFDIETKLYQFSMGERELGDFIESYIPIERSNRKLISPKELDIVIPSCKISIEYNGCWWHSTNSGKPHLHQREKYELCNKLGIRLITIYDDEWENSKELVKEKLKNILNVSTNDKIYARQCTTRTISNNDRDVFLDTYHIQGTIGASINLGLYYNNELVSVLLFRDDNNHHTLVRYASKYNVIGGFSKLLSYFRNNYEWNKIVTFTDLRWHTGDMYIKTGFVEDGYLSPEYEYVVNGKRYHKFNFRKSSIATKFGDLYNPDETEAENMERLGIPKIYDCGKIRFVMKNE